MSLCVLCQSELTECESSDRCPKCGRGGLCMGCMDDHDCSPSLIARINEMLTSTVLSGFVSPYGALGNVAKKPKPLRKDGSQPSMNAKEKAARKGR